VIAVVLLAACASPAPEEPTKPEPTKPEPTEPAKPEPTTPEEPTSEFPDVYKFGTLQAMTGFGAYWGQTETEGQYLAIDEINATGEFPFKLELIVGDHASDDPVKGLNAATKMVHVDNVPWIATSWVATTLAVQPLCVENEVALVNAGGCGESMIGLPWLHHTRLDSSQGLPPVIQYAYDQGSRKHAMIWWNDATGIGFAKVVREKAKQLGMEIVFDEGYEPGATDYRSLIAKMEASNPDSYGIWACGTDIGYFCKQVREAGIDLPIYGFDLNITAIEAAGEHIEGYVYGADVWSTEIDTDWNRSFIQAYMDKWGYEDPKEIDVFAAYYYELTYVLRDTLRYVLANGGDPFNGREMEIAIGKVRFPNPILR